MRKGRAEENLDPRPPYHWSDEEINRYLAMHHRSIVDLAFIRGEAPS